VAAVSLWVPISAVTARQQTPPSTDLLVAGARDLSRAYDYEAALELAQEAVRLDPFHLEANELLRSLSLRLGADVSWEARYRDLVAAHPDSAAAYYLLSTAVASSELSEGYLRRAVQLDPAFAPATLALASAWSGSDDAARAEAALSMAREAAVTMPGNYEAASTYVAVLQRHNRNSEAIAFLRQMTARYPQELRFWTRLWQLQAVADRAERVRLLPRILAQRHRFMDSLAHMEMLANALAWAGQDAADDIVATWRAIADRYPDHPRAELALLQALQKTSDAFVKREILRVLDERYPASPARYAAYSDLLMNLMRAEQYDEAIDLSKTLLTLPDPGFIDRGAARDPRVRRPSFGRSLECIGHAGWFAAAQASMTPTFLDGPPLSGEDPLAALDEGAALAPEAAAAARALATSDCTDARIVLVVGQSVAYSPAFRSLGIELLERAVDLYGSDPVEGFSPVVVDRSRELLAYLYLREGRVADAARAVDELLAEDGDRTPLFFRIAGEVYEDAERPEEARRAYLRALDGSSRNAEFARRALDRIYGSRPGNEIVIVDRGDATRLPVDTRLRIAHLGVDAPLERLIGDEATLVFLWSTRMEGSRALASSLASLQRAFEPGSLDTLSVVVGFDLDATTSGLTKAPFADSQDQGVVMSYVDLARWDVDELPTTLLVDDAGRVLARQMSYAAAPAEWVAAWRSTIAKLREQRPPGEWERP
jgi:tetratricopeptide (TPR) repeat protein